MHPYCLECIQLDRGFGAEEFEVNQVIRFKGKGKEAHLYAIAAAGGLKGEFVDSGRARPKDLLPEMARNLLGADKA